MFSGVRGKHPKLLGLCEGPCANSSIAGPAVNGKERYNKALHLPLLCYWQELLSSSRERAFRCWVTVKDLLKSEVQVIHSRLLGMAWNCRHRLPNPGSEKSIRNNIERADPTGWLRGSLKASTSSFEQKVPFQR